MNLEDDEIARRALIIANDYDGIFSPNFAFYLLSIKYSATMSLNAFATYEHYKCEDVDSEILVGLIQDGVTHAAALSRFFWPTAMKTKTQGKEIIEMRKARGQKLRQKFGIDESSPLFERSLRNAWEHFDERLDNYLLVNDCGYFFPTVTVGKIEPSDGVPHHFFKHLDIQNGKLLIMNEEYDFLKIQIEVKRIYELTLKLLKSA